MPSAVERKLTTILSIDAAGYSRLMAQDEAGTLDTLRSCREAISDLVTELRGRIVNTAGDSLLAEFASVVNAVACAVSIQRVLGERNATRPPVQQMWFRIGINLGDVMVEDSDLFGDGVNVAARLQALAEPGGILISGTVFEHVRDKLALGFDYLGPQPVKNIAAPVPTYRVILEPGAAAPAPHERSAPPEARPGDEAGQVRPARARRLYKQAATVGVLIVFLFAVNMLSDPHDLWFQWPTLGILLLFGLRTVRELEPKHADDGHRHRPQRHRRTDAR
jgi:adenylate cyclase